MDDQPPRTLRRAVGYYNGAARPDPLLAGECLDEHELDELARANQRAARERRDVGLAARLAAAEREETWLESRLVAVRRELRRLTRARA